MDMAAIRAEEEEAAAELVDAAKIGYAGRIDEAVRFISESILEGMVPIGVGLLAMASLSDQAVLDQEASRAIDKPEPTP